MNADYELFKDKLGQISRHWISSGLPSHQALQSTADDLEKWKLKRDIPGLWPDTPLMLTATLDDGIGQGIAIIERFAALAGLEVQRIGLLQYPGFIIEKCHILRPALLGLTVLQLDSDDALAEIGRNRPLQTTIIAGGPAFKFDPDMGRRCRVDYVAPNVGYFLEYLLDWAPFDRPVSTW
jgi:hypothetical protein